MNQSSPAIGVEAVALARDGDSRADLAQLARLHEPDTVEQPQSVLRPAHERRQRAGIRPWRLATGAARAADHDGEAPEPSRAGALEERERVLLVACEECRGPPCERGPDGLLESWLHLQRREREPLALGGERAGRGRHAFAFGERALECREPLLRRARALCEVVALGSRRARNGACLVRTLLELGRAGRTASRVHPGDIVLGT